MEINSNPKFQKIKVANCIAIGGMIAFGKSTLANKLNETFKNSNVVYELDNNDNLMMMLLEKMYQRENNTLFASLFQLYFVLNRFENYKHNCNQEHLTIFDRSIFEDWLFAKENINRPAVFNYYDSLWHCVVNELIYKHGIPKLYIILTGNWDLFKQRIYERNRKVEIDNFEKNEQYFKNLLSIYENYLINVCKDFGIDYLLLEASTPTQKQVEIIIEKLEYLNA